MSQKLLTCSLFWGSKNTKTIQQDNFECLPTPGGTLLQRFVDVDSLEARGADIDRRADYDTCRRVELARREEYDKRMEYDRRIQSALCQTRDEGTAEQTEDFHAQVCRLAQMGKIIETLTTMINKSAQSEDAASDRTPKIAITVVGGNGWYQNTVEEVDEGTGEVDACFGFL